MNNLNNKIVYFNKQLEIIKDQVSKSPLLTSELNRSIQKISRDIINSQIKVNSYLEKPKNKNIKKLNELKEELLQLTEEIENLRKKLPIHFQAKETRGFFHKLKESTYDNILNILNKPIRKNVFLVPARQKKNRLLLAKLGQFEEKQRLLNEKNEGLAKQLEILEKQALKFPGRKRKLYKQKEKILEKIFSLNKTLVALEKAKSEILDEKETIDFYQNKADEMQRSAPFIGGERVTIATPDKVNLDGLYFDASKFRKKLAEAGCEHVNLKSKDTLNDKSMEALRISFEDYNKFGGSVISALEVYNAFAEPSITRNADPSAGWQMIWDKKCIFLIRASELPQGSYEVSSHPFLSFNSELKRWEVKEDNFVQTNPQPIDTDSPSSGTVILSSGSGGIYESNKKETLFYLMRNINVMLFNFRGHGESQGDATEKGLKLDMESAFQYVKKRSNHKNNQIIFKALCLSSSTAAYVASKHPGTHILLDQTYSSFKGIVKEHTQKMTEKWLGKKEGIKLNPIKRTISRIATFIATRFAPNISTAKLLAKIEGKIAIFYTHEDEIMGIQHVVENIQAVSKAGKLNSLLVISAPGKHGEGMTGIKASRSIFDKIDELSSQKIEQVKSQIDELLEIIANLKINKVTTRLVGVEKENEAKTINIEIDRLNRIVDEKNLLLESLILQGRTTAIVQDQIDLFLSKVNLGNPLIKTETSQKKHLRSITAFMNAVEELKTLKNELDPFLERNILGFEEKNGAYYFILTDIRQETRTLIITKETLQKIFHYKNSYKKLFHDMDQFEKRNLIESKVYMDLQNLLVDMKRIESKLEMVF